MKKALIVVANLILMISSAQHTYISDRDNSIWRLDSNYNAHHVVDVNLPSGEIIFDIAISSNGDFYGVVDNQIIHIDTSSGNYVVAAGLPNRMNYSSLTSDNNNKIYTIDDYNQTLMCYDVLLGTVQTVHFLGLSTPGDLCFYKGNIIFPTRSYIYAFNLVTQSLKKILCLPVTNYVFWGISNVYDSCGHERIIATNKNRELWELDINHNTTTLLKASLIGEQVLGMATDSEYKSSQCTHSFQSVNCSMSDPNYSDVRSAVSIYPNPSSGYLAIKAETPIEQLRLYNLRGEKVIGLQNLSRSEQIDISELPQGIYMLQVIDSEENRQLIKVFRN